MNLHRLYWLQCKYWRKWCALNTVSRIDLHSFEYNSPRWIRRISRKEKKYCMNISRHSLKLRTMKIYCTFLCNIPMKSENWPVLPLPMCGAANKLFSWGLEIQLYLFKCTTRTHCITRIIFLFVKIQQKSLRLNPSRALFYVVHL